MKSDAARAMRNEKGTTILELSAVLIAFFVLIIGTLDVGRGVWAYNSIAAAARDATRHAIVHGQKSAAPADSTDIEEYVEGRLAGMSSDDVQVTTVWTPDNAQGSTVKVTVVYAFKPAVAMFQPISMSAFSEMAISY